MNFKFQIPNFKLRNQTPIWNLESGIRNLKQGSFNEIFIKKYGFIYIFSGCVGGLRRQLVKHRQYAGKERLSARAGGDNAG